MVRQAPSGLAYRLRLCNFECVSVEGVWVCVCAT